MSEREKKIVDEHEDKRIVELEQKFYAYINEHIKEIHIRSHNQAKKSEEKIAELEEKLNAYIKQENSEDNEHRQRIEDLENIEKYHLGRLWGTINTNKNQLSELKNHDIFRIWSSIRGGGKTTLDALIMNAKGIRRLEEVLREHLESHKFPFNQMNKLKQEIEKLKNQTTNLETYCTNQNDINRDYENQLSEIKKKEQGYWDYIHDNRNKMFENRKALQDLINGFMSVEKYTKKERNEHYRKVLENLSGEKSEKPKKPFKCENCGKKFETYHDGEGYNTGLCPDCKHLQDTVGLDSKPESLYKPIVMIDDDGEGGLEETYLEPKESPAEPLLKEIVQVIIDSMDIPTDELHCQDYYMTASNILHYIRRNHRIVAKADLEWLFDAFAYDEFELHEEWEIIRKYEELKKKYLKE